MSQSDYIKYKKTSNELKFLQKYPSVLTSGDYTDFNQYSLKNKVINSKLLLNQITLDGKQIIFNMELKSATNCPTFCQVRSNRVLNAVSVPVPNKFHTNTGNEDGEIHLRIQCPCKKTTS
jgi:hypothetical protein